MDESEARRPRHIERSSSNQPKEEETKTYRVKEGQHWGTNPELQAGETVELTEAEAAAFLDKLEAVDGPPAGSSSATAGQLPAGAVSATTETVSPPVVDDTQASKPAVPKRPAS